MGLDRRTSARFASFAALACAAALAFAAAGAAGGCTSGVYDGSYDGGAGGPPVSVAVTPGVEASASTADGVFRVTVPAGAFTTATTLTIAALGNRTVDGADVPAYRVSADSALVGTVAVSFTSMNGGGATFQVALEVAPGQLTPVAIGGRSGATYFGIASSLGTFSLTQHAERGFLDSSSACFAACCKKAGNGAPLTAAGASCQCQGNGSSPSQEAFRCFLACPLAEASQRCEALAFDVTPFACGLDGGAGPNPGSPPQSCSTVTNGGPTQTQAASVCCVQRLPNSSTSSTGCQNNDCPGVSVRCNATSQCPAGTTCCASGADTFCARSCEPLARVCASSADCGGQPCVVNALCPFGTCGPTLAGCK